MLLAVGDQISREHADSQAVSLDPSSLLSTDDVVQRISSDIAEEEYCDAVQADDKHHTTLVDRTVGPAGLACTAQFYVPQGALSSDTRLKAHLYSGPKLERVMSHFHDMFLLSPVLTLEPHGQHFAKPVQLRFTSTAVLPGNWRLVLFRTESTFETSSNWQPVLEHDGNTGQVKSYDRGCDYVPETGMLKLSHFCSYCWCGNSNSVLSSNPRFREFYCSVFGHWYGKTYNLTVYLHDRCEDVLKVSASLSSLLF